MSPLEILLVLVIIAVAVAVFVVMIRSDAARTAKGTAEAEANGDPVKKRPPLGVLYFGIGLAFIVFGLFTFFSQR